MIRQIIKINEGKCTGCGICVEACHEGAIVIENGKAKLIREDYCDGLGDCLPTCPANAISFENREAVAYNELAVKEHKEKIKKDNNSCVNEGGCPGSRAKVIQPVTGGMKINYKQKAKYSELRQWPVQIKLLPLKASYFDNSDLLIAADCTAYAYGNFHEDFIKNHVTIIGCSKLDNENYTDKLCAIINNNNIKSIKVVRMEVPCCGGIERMVKDAIRYSTKDIPCEVVVIASNGNIISSTEN